MRPLLTTPDQISVPYFLPWDKYPRVKLKEENDLNLIFSPKKGRNPRISTWNDLRNQHIVFFDFDTLPTRSIDTVIPVSFDHLAQLLERKVTVFDRSRDGETSILKRHGKILRTLSGKVKVAAFIELPLPSKMTTKIFETLAFYFLGDLARDIDHSYAACSSTYLTFEMWEELNQFDYSLVPLDYHAHFGQTWVNEEVDQYFKDIDRLDNKKDKYLHLYRKYNEKLDIRLSLIARRDPTVVEMLKTLMAMPSLITEGFDISQLILANTTGTSQKTMSNKLRKLESLGQLKVINSNTCPGIKAKTYRATGILLKVLRESYKKYSRSRHNLPKHIPNGEWNNTLLLNSFKFLREPGDFLVWFSSLPGHQLRDRRKQARQIFKFIKKISKQRATKREPNNEEVASILEID